MSDDDLMRIVVRGSWDFKFDPDKFLNVEIMAVERHLGVTGLEWQDLLNRGSVGAATGLLYILIKRYENPQIVFTDIVFEASDIWIGGAAETAPFENPDPVGKSDSGEPSPENESQTGTTSTDSDSSPTLISGSDRGNQTNLNTVSTFS